MKSNYYKLFVLLCIFWKNFRKQTLKAKPQHQTNLRSLHELSTSVIFQDIIKNINLNFQQIVAFIHIVLQTPLSVKKILSNFHDDLKSKHNLKEKSLRKMNKNFVSFLKVIDFLWIFPLWNPSEPQTSNHIMKKNHRKKFPTIVDMK